MSVLFVFHKPDGRQYLDLYWYLAWSLGRRTGLGPGCKEIALTGSNKDDAEMLRDGLQGSCAVVVCVVLTRDRYDIYETIAQELRRHRPNDVFVATVALPGDSPIVFQQRLADRTIDAKFEMNGRLEQVSADILAAVGERHPGKITRAPLAPRGTIELFRTFRNTKAINVLRKMSSDSHSAPKEDQTNILHPRLVMESIAAHATGRSVSARLLHNSDIQHRLLTLRRVLNNLERSLRTQRPGTLSKKFAASQSDTIQSLRSAMAGLEEGSIKNTVSTYPTTEKWSAAGTIRLADSVASMVSSRSHSSVDICSAIEQVLDRLDTLIGYTATLPNDFRSAERGAKAKMERVVDLGLFKDEQRELLEPLIEYSIGFEPLIRRGGQSNGS